MPTKSIGLIKELLNKSCYNDLSQQLTAERKLQVIAAQTNDYKEGVNAFLEKRKPNYKGE
jgi:2-(1,2-epoxy-1,2-dihydrophenyl)acetyl-CoA isomerase